ncbi:MAG: hypothetical protein M3514_10900 [Actinomycetota bacterium]|nr:hypothetical protein [Actinomycetota bacterium]
MIKRPSGERTDARNEDNPVAQFGGRFVLLGGQRQRVGEGAELVHLDLPLWVRRASRQISDASSGSWESLYRSPFRQGLRCWGG